jgi:hypothetical protein
MPSLLRVRKYVEAAKLARHCAESERNPHAKQILQEIERSYYRLVEIEKWVVDQQLITVHLLISGCSTVTRERVSPCATTSCPLRQIKTESPRKTTRGTARGRALRAIGAIKRQEHLDGPAVFECNVKSCRRGFEIVHRAPQLLADSAGRSGISSRAALYARPWPDVARGSRAFARKAIGELVFAQCQSGWRLECWHYALLTLGVIH